MMFYYSVGRYRLQIRFVHVSCLAKADTLQGNLIPLLEIKNWRLFQYGQFNVCLPIFWWNMRILPLPVDILNQKELVNMRNVNYVEYARYAGFVVRSNLLLALKDMTLPTASCYPLLVSVQQWKARNVETKPVEKLENTDNI